MATKHDGQSWRRRSTPDTAKSYRIDALHDRQCSAPRAWSTSALQPAVTQAGPNPNGTIKAPLPRKDQGAPSAPCGPKRATRNVSMSRPTPVTAPRHSVAPRNRAGSGIVMPARDRRSCRVACSLGGVVRVTGLQAGENHCDQSRDSRFVTRESASCPQRERDDNHRARERRCSTAPTWRRPRSCAGRPRGAARSHGAQRL